MLIVTTEPCGCSPWYSSEGRDRFKHHHPDCPVVRRNKEIKRKYDKILEKFRREVER